MSRKPHYPQRSDDAAYPVLNRGHNRETLFAQADDKAAFVSFGGPIPLTRHGGPA
ncbi:MAG: hypothetical protein ACRELG_04735 [Gemmataceae bacterium]